MQFSRNGLGPVREDVNVICDLASHDISIANYLLDDTPIAVTATAVPFFGKEKQDIAFITLEYLHKVFVNIQVSWIDPIKQRQLKIVGEKKMLLFDDIASSEKLKIIETGSGYQDISGNFASFQYKIKDGQVIIPNIPYREPLAEDEFDHFSDCIHRNSSPLTGAESAYNVSVVLEAIQRSLSLGGVQTSI
jgi:predicted dehydrogenase